jgi:hypothetical protein
MVFPFLEKMKADLRATQETYIHDTAVSGFVGLLTNLCNVFLQDAAIMTIQGRNHAVLELPYAKTLAFTELLKRMEFTLEDEMEKKINAPSLADAVSEEIQVQINNFQHTLSHGLGVVKNCMKEGNDATTQKFQAVKGAIDGLVTKDDTQEISSVISNMLWENVWVHHYHRPRQRRKLQYQ